MLHVVVLVQVAVEPEGVISMGKIISIANGALVAVFMAQGIMILSTEPGLEILGAGLICLSAFYGSIALLE
jgi:hypothetical protein